MQCQIRTFSNASAKTPLVLAFVIFFLKKSSDNDNKNANALYFDSSTEIGYYCETRAHDINLSNGSHTVGDNNKTLKCLLSTERNARTHNGKAFVSGQILLFSAYAE